MSYEVGLSREVRAFHMMPGMPGPEGERHHHDYRIEVVVERRELGPAGNGLRPGRARGRAGRSYRADRGQRSRGRDPAARRLRRLPSRCSPGGRTRRWPTRCGGQRREARVAGLGVADGLRRLPRGRRRVGGQAALGAGLPGEPLERQPPGDVAQLPHPKQVGATWMTHTPPHPLSVSLVTLGDPNTLTGGYLYHRRLAELAPRYGARLVFASFPAWPFPFPLLRAPRLPRVLAAQGADVVVLDSIAAAFLAPRMTKVRAPVVAMLHQPPGGIDHGPVRRHAQAVLDRRRTGTSSAWWWPVSCSRTSSAHRASPPSSSSSRRGGTWRPQPLDRSGTFAPAARAALLCVGNWVARKGILQALDAVAHLPAGLARLHLVRRRPARSGIRRTGSPPAGLRRPGRPGPVPWPPPAGRRWPRCTATQTVPVCPASASRTARSTVRPWPPGCRGGMAAQPALPGQPRAGGPARRARQRGRTGLRPARPSPKTPSSGPVSARPPGAGRQTFPTWQQTAERFFAAVREAAASGLAALLAPHPCRAGHNAPAFGHPIIAV